MLIIIVDNLVPDVLFQKKEGKGIQVVLLTKLATKHAAVAGTFLIIWEFSLQDDSDEVNYWMLSLHQTMDILCSYVQNLCLW